MAEHCRETLPAGRLLGLLTGRLNQLYALTHLGGFRTQALLCFGEHGRRRVENGDLVAEPRQWQRLMGCAPAHVQDVRWRLGEVVQQLECRTYVRTWPFTDAYAPSTKGSANATHASCGIRR